MATAGGSKPGKKTPIKLHSYPSPMDAMKGSREEIVYVTCIQPNGIKTKKPDYLATIDVRAKSDTFCKVIHRLMMPHFGDELRDFGWNIGSDSIEQSDRKRNLLVLPGINSDRIYVIDVGTNPREPRIQHVVEPEELHRLGVSAPHSVRSMPGGEGVLISTLGDSGGQGKDSLNFVVVNAGVAARQSRAEKLDSGRLQATGSRIHIAEKLTQFLNRHFIQLTGENLDGEIRLWPPLPYIDGSSRAVPFGHDFWINSRFNVLISTEWGGPKYFKQGLRLTDLEDGKYGHSINIVPLDNRDVAQTIDFDVDGIMPLEIRFLHDYVANLGIVNCAFSGNIYLIRLNNTPQNTGKRIWEHVKLIVVQPKVVKNWLYPSMPGFTSDILISMDDKFLYVSNWIHGDIRQYSIRHIEYPVMLGQIFIGGSICNKDVEVTQDVDLDKKPEALNLKGIRVEGGPNKMQLSLDGKRLYVTTSFYSAWDKQFYPKLFKKGSVMLRIDVDTDKGGLTINEKFLVNFGEEPDGPVLAHGIRYPGGDCTSEIWSGDPSDYL